MHTYILIPDSFKGTMSSSEICSIMREQIRKHEPDANIISIPVADGGEGSVDCFLEAMGGERIEIDVCGPFQGEKVHAYYGIIDNGQTAVIEMAACAGLPLVEGRTDPMCTTTYGVGEMILDAAKRGARKIIVGLGGSATNDGGCGAAAAVGIRFYDLHGKQFVPTGGTLSQISKIDIHEKNTYLDNVDIIAMCDIDNPMYGETGAAYVFGSQKGATPHMVEALDKGLRHLSGLFKSELANDVAQISGTGAAGAMGAGMLAFFGAKLQMGIDTVLDAVKFESALKCADLVLTGEGKIDSQSLRGKVVIGVARRARKVGVPVIALVGDIGDDIERVYDEGVSSIISINRLAVDFQISRKHSPENMALTIDNLMRMYLLFTMKGYRAE